MAGANSRKGRQFAQQVIVGAVLFAHDFSCSLEELLSAADNLMYEEKVKKKSRNQ